MPVSIALFLAAGGAVFLQFIPILNMVSWMFLSPWWPGILFSMCMLAVGYEALTSRLPVGLLALPVLWFGGHAAASGMDHYTLAGLRADFTAQNATVRIPIDPTNDALVLPEDFGRYLIQNYRIPIVYSPNTTKRGFAHRSTRLVATEICRPHWNTAEAHRAGIRTSGFHDKSPSGNSVFEQRFCNLSAPEDPSGVAVQIEHKSRDTTVNRLPVTVTDTLIRTPDGRSARLAGGHAAPLSWFPLPGFMCLNKCEFQMSRHRSTPILDPGSRYQSDVIALAKALGLERVDPSQRVGATRSVINNLAAWDAPAEPEQTAASRRRGVHH
jgi:hypothetical protein